MSPEELTVLLKKYKAKEFDPHSGKGFAYVYTQDNEKFKVVEEVYEMFSGGDDDAGTNGVELE